MLDTLIRRGVWVGMMAAAWVGVTAGAWAQDDADALSEEMAAQEATAHETAVQETASQEAASQRPTYQTLRQNEDWSVLAGQDTPQTGDGWDPIKYVPLSDDGSVWASFGGQIRLRGEHWSNFGFASSEDDTFGLVRALLHVDLHLGQHVRAFLQGKSAWSSTRNLPGGRRGLDMDVIDLQQGFMDFTIPLRYEATMTVRVGRQELLFGKQRLVSPLDWSNSRRAWDGLSIAIDVGAWTITPFWTQFAPVQKYKFNDPDSQTEFYGIYATGPVANEALKMDLYWLDLNRQDSTVTFNGTTGSESRHTVGGRVWGKSKESGLDYDVEGAYQWGDLGSADINAYMVSGELGLTMGQHPTAPRLAVGATYATGDKTGGGKVETFNHLFPLGHAFLGYIDAVGRQNIIDLNVGITLKPSEKMVVKITGHHFQLADDADSLYNAGGVARTRTVAGTTSKEVGQEVDLLIKYAFDAHLTGVFGYSHFFASNYIDDSGGAKDVDFIYAILQYTF